MIAACLSVELAGPRLALQCPASRRGPTIVARPSSRCSSRPNARQFSYVSSSPPRHPRIHAGNRPAQANLFHETATKADLKAGSEAQPILGKEEAGLLANLQSLYPRVTAPEPFNHFAFLKEQIANEQQTATFQTPAKLLQSGDAETAASSEEDAGVSQRPPRHQRYFQAALEALRQWDTRRLNLHLQRFVALPTAELQQAVAELPPTTISELLRSLDPMKAAAQNDPSHGRRISVGMYRHLNLQEHMDLYGSRNLFKLLLTRMLVVVECFRETGGILEPQDYISMFRAYGALSDIAGAKRLWLQLFGNTLQRPDPDILREFIKVRFLADPMYYGFDKTRVALQPRNLHRRRYLRLYRNLQRLERLRYNRQRRSLQFGLDRSQSIADPLHRRMRGIRPITRMFRSWVKVRRYEVTEDVACIFMIGFARANSLRFINYRILSKYFGIFTLKDPQTGEIKAEKYTPKDMQPGYKRPYIQPTTQLLNTIVEVYCSNSQLSWAYILLDYISREFQIPIPQETWFELLEWSHVCSSSSQTTALKYIDWHEQVPPRDATELIWKAMMRTCENVQPGFDQYAILVRAQIGRGKFLRADDENMAKMRALYDEQCVRYEEAVFEYITTLRDGVTPITPLWARYQRARFRKSQMWFTLSEICKRNLAGLHPDGRKSVDTRSAVDAPDFIWRNERFVENGASYRTPAGYVYLFDPARTVKIPMNRTRGRIEVPMRMNHTWRLMAVRQRTWDIVGPWSLVRFKNSRLSPLPLLSGGLDTLQLPSLRSEGTLERYKRHKRQFEKQRIRREALLPNLLAINKPAQM
ncbi:uncharacterized protein PG998_006203 [Apiospora kogelbergensis]|uniref:uncharacterized protein n=1 Tax=Apiospora kogelbergensis TaxID=1337665 RepID=UPI0031319B5B